MEKLPIYRAIIDNEEAGMVTISLVDFPATESDFQAFEEQKKLIKFAVENEEKHIVRGLVMAANMLIYRIHPQFGEYYIYYDAETLRIMAERYLKNNFQNNVDLNHDGELVDGVDMVQFFIKDSENGINPKGFEDYADGSLFAEFHVNNEDVWNAIKDGTYAGFSLEGYFGIEPTGQEFKEQNNNKEITKKYMSKLERIKQVLKSLLVEFGEVSTDKGVVIFDGDELEAGMMVHGIDEEGNEVQLEDGDYRTEDKKVITIEGGKVVEIKDDEAEVATDEPAAEEPQENADDDPAIEPAEEPSTEDEPSTDEKDNLIAELQARIAELEAENQELRDRIAELEKEPAAPSAEEEFEKISKVDDKTPAGKMRKKGYTW